MKRISAVALAGTLALGGIALAGCSSSDSTTEPTAGASETLVGGNPGTWTPLDITQSVNGTTVDMVVGQAGTFSDLPDDPTVVVESSDPTIVEASQARTEGDAVYLAGIVAKAPGTATITVKYSDMAEDTAGASNVIEEFTVNVTEG
jgi:ABC-type transport system substrate-binding protein